MGNLANLHHELAVKAHVQAGLGTDNNEMYSKT